MDRNSLKIRFSWLSVSVFLIMLYAYSTSLWKYVYFSNIIRNLTLYIVAISMAMLLLATGLRYQQCSQFLLMIAVLFIVINNKDFAKGDIYYLRGILTMILFLLAPKKNDRWIKTGYKIIVFSTLFFAFFTIWFAFDTFFYSTKILTLFDEASQQQLIYSLNRGASAGLTKNYSINATFLVEGILAIISFYVFGNKNWSKKGIVFLLISLFALFLTGKRAHIVFLAAVNIVGYYFYNDDKKRGRIFKILAISVCTLLLFIVAAQFVPSIMLFYNRFVETANSGDITMGRIAFYIVAIEQFIKNPIFGIGWGGFKYVNTGYAGFRSGSYANAHNMYLQLLCETGILGFCLFMLLFWGVFTKSVKLLKKAKKCEDLISAKRLLYAMMLQLFVMLYGITGNPIYDLETMAFYIFTCAITMFYSQKDKYGFFEMQEIN